MEKWLADMMPVLGVENDAIISRCGDVTICYEATLPEIFTLSGDEYESLHQTWIKALKILPRQIIFHKQDWFTPARYTPQSKSNDVSFLAKSSDQFFSGRVYTDHKCYIYLTKKPAGRKLSSSLFSNLLRKSIVPEETLSPQLFQEFSDSAGQFKRIVEDGGFMTLRRLPDDELASLKNKAGILEKYFFLLKDGELLVNDISLHHGIRVGNKHCELYSMADPDELPQLCGPRINYDKYSTDRTKFSIGFAAPLGCILPCNHIYNQYIFLDDGQKTIRQLENKKLRLQSLSAYSRENAVARDATNDFLNEAVTHQRLPVKAHFNLLIWSNDKDELKNMRNVVSSALAQMDAIPKQQTAGAPQIYWAGIPGNAADFPMNDTFDTFVEQACCFLNLETNYRSSKSPATIRFGDRLTGKPIEIDLFDEPMQNGTTTNRGMFVCGGSGTGKSLVCNHIVRSLYDQGAHIVIVDIGGSYKGLCELVDGYYFTYSEKDPIRFNPFYLSKGDFLDTEKKESLKSLLATLWKHEHETFNRSEYVALSNAIQGYYNLLEKEKNIFPCFNSFYEYLQTEYVELLRIQRVREKYFDVENFLYVLRPYYNGGEFDYLLNAEKNLDLLDRRFIVFELDNIKDHPILFPVVSLIIMESFISKVRKIPELIKVLDIEEAWKAMLRAGMAEFMRYGFKTLRKLYGVPIVVTQEIDDLTSSPIIKDAIIGNSDIKILTDMRKFINKFDALQATLGMSDKGKTQLFSVNRANEPGRKYKELYLELGPIIKVLRNEPSPEEYYAYTTEPKEKLQVMEYAKNYGSYSKGIETLVADLKQAGYKKNSGA